jgi:hypothetical protein
MVQVAQLEARVGNLVEENKGHKGDFRWTWGGLVVGFLVLAGLFIAGYNRMDDKLDKVFDRFVSISDSLGKADAANARIETKIDDLSAIIHKH